MIPQKPIILLQNNTDGILPVNLFTSSQTLGGMNNSPLTYTWNITGSLLALTTLQLQVKTSGISSFTVLQANIPTSDIQGILAALNSLNVGTFFLKIVGANTFIATANNFYIYGDLTVNHANAQWITTGGIQVNNLTDTTGVNLTAIDQRSGQLLSLANTSAAAPFFLPFVSSITYLAAQLQDGDIIHLNVVYFVIGYGGSTQLILKENGTVILTQTIAGMSAIFVFTYHQDAVYDFNLTGI